LKSITRHFQDLRKNGFKEFKRKVYVILNQILRKLIIPYTYTIGPILYMFLRAIKFLIHIRIGEVESRIIGHCSLPIEIYLSEKDFFKESSKSKKTIDIFFHNKKISNIFLLNKWKCYFTFGPRVLLSPLYHFMLDFFPKSIHLVPYRHWKIDPVNWNQVDIYNVLDKTSPHLYFNDLEIFECNSVLNEFGIKKNDKIICFHVRDPFFHGGDNAVYGPRDSHIKLFEPSMLFLANKGYKVVRVGRAVLSPVSVRHQNIFDYANSNVKSDMLDIYLMSRTLFTVGTISGLESVSTMFRKKLCPINCVEWRGLDSYNSQQCPIFLPKKFYWNETLKPLSIKEIVETKSYEFLFNEQFEKAGIFYKDNSPDDIIDAIEEMLNIVLEENLYGIDDFDLATKFSLEIPDRKGRKFEIRLSAKFLKKNKEYLLQNIN
jgi:putative glycosyltransferase (TIGR04372 family)